jgi:uncharacterized protein YegP (UPF0339 family)
MIPVKEGFFIMTGANIIKTKAGKFRVKYYATNGELLAVSEVLNSRQSANKNFKAMAKIFIGQTITGTPKGFFTL